MAERVNPQPSLWESPTQTGLRKLRLTAGKHEAAIRALVPLAQELARKAGLHGVTVCDLRVTATQRGLLGASTGRQFSFLGAVMRAAGLRATDQWRRSILEASNGNLQRVWCL